MTFPDFLGIIITKYIHLEMGFPVRNVGFPLLQDLPKSGDSGCACICGNIAGGTSDLGIHSSEKKSSPWSTVRQTNIICNYMILYVHLCL
jgi:hypothetical protein